MIGKLCDWLRRRRYERLPERFDDSADVLNKVVLCALVGDDETRRRLEGMVADSAHGGDREIRGFMLALADSNDKRVRQFKDDLVREVFRRTDWGWVTRSLNEGPDWTVLDR